MRFFSWLNGRKALNNRDHSAHGRRNGSTRQPAARYRPVLEALSDRCLPSTLTVTSTADSGPDSLRADVAAAQPGDTIAFSKSLKGQTITLSSGELLLNKSLNIQGPGAGQLTISGGNTSRLFEVAAGVQVTLAGLTLSAGDGRAAVVAYTASDGDGGAILNWGTLTVSSSTISGNTGYRAGGLYNDGTLTVSNSTISGNTAYRAGGLYNDGSASISGSTISGNTATGGYIGSTGGVDEITFHWLQGGGGGLWNAGTMTVSGSTVSGNQAGGPVGGGGVYNSGTLTVSSTVTGNAANAYGGGIYNDEDATLTLKQATVTQNTAGIGADLYNDHGYVTSKGSTVGVTGP